MAVLFARFGPYHLARLAGAARALERGGKKLLAIEIARTDKTYAWKLETGSTPFQRVTLFNDRPHEELTAKEVLAALSAALSPHRVEAIAIPGWAFAESKAALWWARAHQVPAVLMSESTRHDARRSWWREWLKRGMVAQFDAALVGGADHADYCEELGMPADRIQRGYDAIDNEFFSRGSDAARRDPSVRERLRLPERYFLASNRFIPIKNLSRLLSSYERYRRRHPRDGWDLVMCGDGPLMDDLRRQADEMPFGKAVHFPGFVQYPDLPTYYGLAGAFVHASTVEPWGLVVNEAMASGLPVIVSRSCGCARDLVIKGETGWTFDPLNEEELAQRMEDAAHRADREEMGRRGRLHVAGWSADAFGAGLVAAVRAARERPRRTLPLVDHISRWLLR